MAEKPIGMMKTILPYTFRNNLTIDDDEYGLYLNYELNRINEKNGDGDKEYAKRLRCALNNKPALEGNFIINLFAAEDGQAIYYNEWKCDYAEDVVICLNGLESHGGWFADIAHRCNENRMAVYAIDRRGSGLNARNKGTWKEWMADVARVTEIAKQEHPDCKVHLLSICYGAKLAAACAIRYPHKFDTLIFMSPGFNVKVAPSRKEKILIGLNMLTGFDSHIESPIKEDEYFTDSNEALYYIFEDKLRTRSPRASDFVQSQILDSYIRKNLKNVDTPSLVLLAGKDQILDNYKTKKTIRQFSKAPEIIEYPDSKHVIFFGNDRDKMIADVIGFVNQTKPVNV